MQFTSCFAVLVASTTVLSFTFSPFHDTCGIAVSSILVFSGLVSAYAVPPPQLPDQILEKRWITLVRRQDDAVDAPPTDAITDTIGAIPDPTPTPDLTVSSDPPATSNSTITIDPTDTADPTLTPLPLPDDGSQGSGNNTAPINPDKPKNNSTMPGHCHHHPGKPHKPGKPTMLFNRMHSNGTSPGHGPKPPKAHGCHHGTKPRPKPGNPSKPHNGTQPVNPGKDCNSQGGEKNGQMNGKCKDKGKGKGSNSKGDGGKNANMGQGMSIDKDIDSKDGQN